MQSCFMFQNYFIYLFWRGTGWTKLRIALKGVWLLNVKLAGPSNVWKHVGQIQKQMLCDAVNSPKKLKSACHLGITGPEAEGKGCKNWKWILKLKLCAVQKKKKKKQQARIWMVWQRTRQIVPLTIWLKMLPWKNSVCQTWASKKDHSYYNFRPTFVPEQLNNLVFIYAPLLILPLCNALNKLVCHYCVPFFFHALLHCYLIY